MTRFERPVKDLYYCLNLVFFELARTHDFQWLAHQLYGKTASRPRRAHYRCRRHLRTIEAAAKSACAGAATIFSVVPKFYKERAEARCTPFRVASRADSGNDRCAVPKQPPKLAEDKNTMRRARRACGEWRSCQVLSDLLPSVSKQLRTLWSAVLGNWSDLRQRSAANVRYGARERSFASSICSGSPKLVKSKGGQSLESATDVRSFCRGYFRGVSAMAIRLALAQRRSQRRNIHGFRIRTKRLRYCIEWPMCSIARSTRSLKWLKSLQEVLGHWHDRVELVNICAKTLATLALLRMSPMWPHYSCQRLIRRNRKNKSEVADITPTSNHSKKSGRRWSPGFRSWPVARTTLRALVGVSNPRSQREIGINSRQIFV